MVFEIDMPGGWKNFRLPSALQDRLHELLDRQDMEGKLSARERREAQALVDMVEMLSLLKLHAKQKVVRSKR